MSALTVPVIKEGQQEDFFKNLKSFTNFNEVSFESHYTIVPSSWYVILTDIKGSTAAILNGKYKDVNIIGAACIAGVESVVGSENAASVFGGDGCSILISASRLEEVKQKLNEIRNSSKEKFNLDLRIAIIPMTTLNQKGHVVKVAKLKLAKDKYVAQFTGGGLLAAERLMKDNSSFEMEKLNDEYYDFKNLSCRWKPIKNENGVIVTLIVQAKEFSQYEYVLEEMNNILINSEDFINPIKTKNMKYEGFFSMLKSESRMEKKIFSKAYFERVLIISFCYMCFKVFKNKLPKNLKEYLYSMSHHSDFRKFDDTLRMVLDCSVEQANKLENFFNRLYIDGQVNYGIHLSDSSLMTCVVDTIQEGEHIHFVDGSNGGYALAAKNLKQQKK